MKSFRDYVRETEASIDQPISGDLFDIEMSPVELVESYVIETTDDGYIIHMDENIYTILESRGLIEDYNPDLPTHVHSHPTPHREINTEISNTDNDAFEEDEFDEAKYRGREVPLGKPMRGDVKKSKVYVRDPKTGNIKKVNFGDKKLSIKKHLPKHRKSFRARHHCANPGPRTKARYWSCRAW